MKKYIFSEAELDIIRFLKHENPRRIWWNPIQYIFDFDYLHIIIEIQCAEKLMIDDISSEYIIKSEKGEINVLEQYVRNVSLEKVISEYTPNETCRLLCSNEEINDIKIVRTLLYFCKHRISEQNKGQFFCDSSLINPNLQIDKNIKVERTYLVDVGLLIILKDKFLNCFILENDDDFERNILFQTDNLVNSKKELYEFIDIE